MGKSTNWFLRLFGGKKTSKLSEEKYSSDVGDKNNAKRAAPKEKRKWSFGGGRSSSPSSNSSAVVQSAHQQGFGSRDMEQEQNKHAMAVVAASTAAAEAALAAANAAAAVARLTGNGFSFHATSSHLHWAAITIQTAFRGYLARRALRALKGVVRLQALFRGHRVRKQAAMTLRCMQALIRVQARVRASRVRMSTEGQAVQRQLSQMRRCNQQARPRKSMEGWNASSCTVEDLNMKNEKRQEAARKRERALAYAIAQQKILKEDSSATEPDTSHWEWSWLERWMAARPWESPSTEDVKGQFGNSTMEGYANGASDKIFGRDSKILKANHNKMQNTRNATKLASTVETYSITPNTSSSTSTGIYTWPSPPVESFRQRDPSPKLGKQPISLASHPSTPSMSGRSSGRSSLPTSMPENGLHALQRDYSLQQEEGGASSSTNSSPAFELSGPHVAMKHGTPAAASIRGFPQFPNYMTPTKSTKAKVRSQSAPRQRPMVFEKDSRVVTKQRYSLPWADNASCFEASQSRRSISQLRTRNNAYASSVALDRSSNSLNDAHSAWSVSADYRRPFRF